MCGPALAQLSNTAGLCNKAESPFGSLLLPSTGHVTFTKLAKLSEPDRQMDSFIPQIFAEYPLCARARDFIPSFSVGFKEKEY